MSTDSAQCYFLWNGEVLHNIYNVDENPNGGGATIRRGITPSRRALGRRKGQEADWTITFDRDVLEGEKVSPFQKGDRGTFTVVADTQTTNYEDCEVDIDPNPKTDDNGNRVQSITITAIYREEF